MDKGVLLIGGLTIVVVAILFAFAVSSPEAKPAVGEAIELQDPAHIVEGESHPPYNSNPPSSGWHYAQPAPWGIKDQAVVDETLIHNLEHGGVWVAYHPERVDAATVEKLKEIARGFPSKVILSPRPANDAPIALVSWGRLTKLESFDEEKIREFMTNNRNKGPERIPD